VKRINMEMTAWLVWDGILAVYTGQAVLGTVGSTKSGA
jgi:hypothetical protein